MSLSLDALFFIFSYQFVDSLCIEDSKSIDYL